jgi:nucleotide-binding universal stress UspA family protein
MEDCQMYKTILAPLDGSKRAEAILPHLEQLAGRYKAKVIFLQAIEQTLLFVRPETADIEQKEYDEEVKQAKVYLDGLKGVFREKGIKARAFITHAPVVEAIIKAAERENADLIALASHGRTGLSRVFYGSVAAGILHRIDRPLLLIRSD